MASTVISHLSLHIKPQKHIHPVKPVKSKSFITCCISVESQLTSTITVPNPSLRVVFAAGGAGAQIFPAVAIADEIKAISPDAQILFIGTDTGMESTAVPSTGYDFTAIPATPLARPVLSFRNMLIPFKWAKSMAESWRIMKQFKPQVVVGTGGYVSFPICMIATLKGLKVAIHEQCLVPNLANWALSFLADVVFVGHNSSLDGFSCDKKKIIVSGNPVRMSLRKYVSKAVARGYFFPKLAQVVDSDVKVVLVLGGSFGANSMNIALFNVYTQMLSERPDLHLIWETGVEAFDEMESLVRSHPRLVLAPDVDRFAETRFLNSMDSAYAAADLVVSRAGAMTCSELLVTGKPAILIPSPNVAEGYQFKNASLMADLADSRIITEDELDSTTLQTAIAEILDNEQLLTTMSERALQAGKPNAGAEIAEYVMSLVSFSPVRD
ncbi:hypothetical protein KSS87_018796 [Heliosperma pusillum]|nr:hypothetical protein KSS87_018796 [Heliosperma pusillum]